MLLAAGALGLVVVAGVTIAMAVIARLCPPGPARELIGFLPNCIVLLRRLRSRSSIPGRARLALGAALAYVLSPIQVIPNVVPVLGQLDDIIVVAAALRYTCRRLPRAQIEAEWPGDGASLERLLGLPLSSSEDKRAA
jgi:uncharacterized membrane protein YkvA (DUF1232 family)